MTKQDLLDALSTKFHRVEDPGEPRQKYGNLWYYLVKVYDLVGEGLRDMNIPFYVEDEGLPSEVAYWSPSEPKPTPVSGFQQEVTIYISGKIADGTIEGAFSEMLDTVNETAIYKVVMPDLTEKRLFVDKDGDGDLRYRSMA